jgi:hypothetical protein
MFKKNRHKVANARGKLLRDAFGQQFNIDEGNNKNNKSPTDFGLSLVFACDQ